MKFLDLFAGIGGFRLGMERAGHECVGFCEIDQFARKSYKAIHNTEGELEFHDITAVTDESIRQLGHIDVICGGFPCQAFSVAGKRKGFEDTRGTLFFEIARFASILKPRYLFLENVKGLLNHDKGNTFETILAALSELGYDAEVFDDAMVFGNAEVCGDAVIKSTEDYIVFKNNWSSGRYFTYTKSNKMWKVGCFYGTGQELIEKAYADGELSGKCYEAYVKFVEQLENIQIK